VKRWRLHMRASRLIGRAEFVAAAEIYEQLLSCEPTDPFAMAMLSLCYERQGRCLEALHLAEEGVRSRPRSLSALQAAGRLAVAVEQHDKAARYLQQALTLPEVRGEIPKEAAMPPLVLWLLRVVVSFPILRTRIRPDALNELELGSQAMQLQEWKRWAQDYLAWHGNTERGNPGSLVH
jgi:tetratricopeptide (TPR) repeat protein